MIPHETWGIVFGLVFYLVSKFSCYLYKHLGTSMYNRKHCLSSIPEKNESEEEEVLSRSKYVPKNKHEVLKAKYKCLKKLFQIYDASIIGMLPSENFNPDDSYTVPEEAADERRQRRRTKTDACAGPECADLTLCEKASVASSVIRDLKTKCSCSTQVGSEPSQQTMSEPEVKKAETPEPKVETSAESNLDHFLPSNPYINDLQTYLMMDPPRKPTRFQAFMQRLFGIRRERVMPNGHIYASSDNNVMNCADKRRRRGLRFRRLSKSKRVHSEVQLRDLNSPTIMNYVQSVQRHCLTDRTPRQCPVLGCKNIFYGIINYNDHLNLCHFTSKKFICHYCHEGFEGDTEKLIHENEHLGIPKLKHNLQNLSASTINNRPSKSSDTQTDPTTSPISSEVPEEKLKKIVSFFDKMADTEQMLTEFKKKRLSEGNLQKPESDVCSEPDTVSSDKRTVSCGNLLMRKDKSRTSTNCSCSAFKCHFCGEEFDYRRQLVLHTAAEHGGRAKGPKFHSCAGLTDCQRRPRAAVVKSKAGEINIESSHNMSMVTSTTSDDDDDTYSQASRPNSQDTMSYDPSTNIIFCESIQSIKNTLKKRSNNSMVSKIAHGIANYRWEPGTKIIRV